MTWKEYGDLVYYGCAIVAGLFVLIYLTIAPWWKTLTGRNIMAVMGSMAATLIYFAFAIRNKGVSPGYYPVRALLFTAMFLSVGWRIAILVKAQLFSRRKGDSYEPQHVGEDG